MKTEKNKLNKINAILFIIVLLSTTTIVYHFNTKDIILKIANMGAGPHNYVAEKIHPENFIKNWETAGVGKYDYSLPMKIYYYLAKYAGITPTKTIYPFMFIQTILFLSSVAFLTHTLFKNIFVTVLSVFLISLSNLPGLNLSRFGNGFGSYLSLPLFYAYANAFRIFSLGFFFKNKYILMFFFLALSIYCHVNMGLFALAFIGGYFLFKPKILGSKSFVIGLLVFLVLVIPYILFIFTKSSISSGGIPTDLWVKSTKIFSYHWYPITTMMFTRNANTHFFPFLIAIVCFFISFRYQDLNEEKNKKVIAGSLLLLFLSILGIIFAEIIPVPILIKISFQRSTAIITFLSVLYYIYYLYQCTQGEDKSRIILSIYSITLLLFSNPGIAVLPIVCFFYQDVKQGYLGPIKLSILNFNRIKIYFLIILSFFIIIFFLNIIKNYNIHIKYLLNYFWTPLHNFNPFLPNDFLIRGGTFKKTDILPFIFLSTIFITFFSIYTHIAKNNKRNIKLIFFGFITVMIITVWFFQRQQYLQWHNTYADFSRSYMDVQIWVKNNTKKTTLIMYDPTHYYGFRDFSERSYFGNLREWGYASITYNPDKHIFAEGLERLNEFGVDLEKVTYGDIKSYSTFPYSTKYDHDVREYYYKMDVDEINRLYMKYGIEYFIFCKNYELKNQQKLFNKYNLVYSNKYFNILSIT